MNAAICETGGGLETIWDHAKYFPPWEYSAKKLLTKDALGFLELHGSHDLLENGELLFFDGGQKIMFLLHQNVCAD